ncbi:MAG: hypothetical protein WBC50_07680 [Dehalococcoidales bacterium]
MESAAGAASMGGSVGTALGGPAAPGGSYTGNLTFEEWKKRKGVLPGQGQQRDLWEEWDAWNQNQSLLRSRGAGQRYLKPGPEPEPEREEVGSSPGFEKVQRFLRQQRATGRVVSPNETRMAWQGYWDAWAGKQTERERIGIERERLDLQAKQWAWQRSFSEEGRELDESAAASQGGAVIGTVSGFAVGGPVGAFAGGAIGGMIGGSK